LESLKPEFCRSLPEFRSWIAYFKTHFFQRIAPRASETHAWDSKSSIANGISDFSRNARQFNGARETSRRLQWGETRR
jgi:hypothetical protein